MPEQVSDSGPLTSRKRVVLIGLPGSGKSTVGRQLARERGLTFADTDHEIERRTGCTVRDFFAREGEASFRDLEEQVLRELLTGEAKVLATGGGVVVREANRQRLKECGEVIYLRAMPDDVARRLSRDTQRPLLQVADPRQRLQQLFAERDPLYRSVASYVIETSRKSVSMLVHTVSMQLDMAAGAAR